MSLPAVAFSHFKGGKKPSPVLLATLVTVLSESLDGVGSVSAS